MTLVWATAKEEPRVHYALAGPWLLVISPLGTNRFSAWSQRIGWDRGEVRYFRELATAKAWLEEQARQIEGRTT